jgi:hypothetical protein
MILTEDDLEKGLLAKESDFYIMISKREMLCEGIQNIKTNQMTN